MSELKILLSSLILMLMSLENYGDGRYIPIIIILGVLLILSFPIYISKDIATKTIISLCIILLLTIADYFNFLSFRSNLEDYSPSSFFLSFSFKVILITIFVICINEMSANVIKIIKAVLLLHCTVFFIQFFVVYTTGYYLDFLSFYTGEAQRYVSGVSIPFIGDIYRPTGFFNEPSTYTAYVMLLLLSLVVVRYKSELNFTKNDIKYIFIVCLTSILTFSVAALIYVSLFLLVFFFHKRYKAIFIGIAFALILLSPLLFVFFQERAGYLEGNSTSIRSNLIDLVNSREWLEIIFGSGPSGMPDTLASYLNTENYSWASNGLAAPSDNGTLFFIYIKYGIIGMILFLLFLIKYMPNKKTILLSLILLLAKAKYSSFIFLFLMLITFFNLRKEANA